MEAFLPDTAEAVLLGLIAIALALAWLRRAFPQVAWLQVFRLPAIHMSAEQRARQRRTSDRLVALEIMAAGLALPLLYVGSQIMLFNDIKGTPMIIAGACSVLCIALGIWILVRNR